MAARTGFGQASSRHYISQWPHSVTGAISAACAVKSGESQHPDPVPGDHVSMTDFLAGYVVPAGTGVADDPGLKASRRSAAGALNVFETTIGARPPLPVQAREADCVCVPAGGVSVRGLRRPCIAR